MELQAMIEDVSSEAFPAYSSRAVFGPTGVSAAAYAITPQSAFAYGSYKSGQRVVGSFRRHPKTAAAGLWATVTGLAKILQSVAVSLCRERHAILPFELATRMITPVSQDSGLGIFVEPEHVIWQEAQNDGFDAVMVEELTAG